MFSLCVLVLTLLVSAVDASSSSGGSPPKFNPGVDLPRSGLNTLYNSPVQTAEWMERRKQNFNWLPSFVPNWAPVTHSGVRVTLEDGSQWLVHKGRNVGIDSQTVVTDANHMSSRWTVKETKDFDGTRTVGDFVDAGGEKYSLVGGNCHNAAEDMMGQ